MIETDGQATQDVPITFQESEFSRYQTSKVIFWISETAFHNLRTVHLLMGHFLRAFVALFRNVEVMHRNLQISFPKPYQTIITVIVVLETCKPDTHNSFIRNERRFWSRVEESLRNKHVKSIFS